MTAARPPAVSTSPGRQASPDDYRGFMASFPTGVSVVTAADPSGVPYGMTCSAVTSVTLTPPTLLVCLRDGSLTLRAVRASETFAVNLLHSRARHVAEVFSTSGPDRFGQVRWGRARSGLPYLTEDSFALAECRVVETRTVGDHVMVIGQVQEVERTADTPLLYGLREFAAWPPALGSP